MRIRKYFENYYASKVGIGKIIYYSYLHILKIAQIPMNHH